MGKYYVEVGGGDVLTLWDRLNPDDTLEVFEPNPKNIARLKQDYGSRIKIYPYAIWKENGTVQLSDSGPNSYIQGLKSPEICNNEIQSQFFHKVEARTFDQFDNGDIDCLCLDMEGSEWYVLEKLISRPEIIIIEMEHASYQNPFFNEIIKWMNYHEYELQSKEGANFVYRKLNTVV